MIIEHRPRLQSANFFMQFDGPIGDEEKINVVLRSDSVEIKRHGADGAAVGGLLVSTRGLLDVLTNSLSALVAKDGYLSFRVSTNSRHFQSELLRSQPNQLEVDRLKSNVILNTEYVIKCSNCTRDLGRGKWTRILELPSENFDAGDWFCHKKIDIDVASPRPTELFYGYYYWLANADVFEEKKVMIKTSQLVYCKRCLQFLGQRMNGRDDKLKEDGGGADGAIKIWNENLRFQVADKGGGVERQDTYLLQCRSSLGNFANLIRKIVHDFEFVDQFTRLLPTMHKMLVKSMRTDSSKDVPGLYLLVQVMDMNLGIFQWDGEQLKCEHAMKVLYCFVDAANGKDDQLLKYWLHDDNVHPLQVSPMMFETVLTALNENSLLIPGAYRHNYGFDLSYIFIE